MKEFVSSQPTIYLENVFTVFTFSREIEEHLKFHEIEIEI